jgi:1-acyl-sn-glycerol-3-phosphate acyltransferase
MRRCRPWLKGAAVAGMFLLGVIAVGAVMPALRLMLRRRADRLNEAIVQNWNRAVCRILNLRPHVTGEPDSDAKLLVANHISWLDIIALGAQRRCVFVAKEEVGGWPVMGYLARGIGTLFVRRGDGSQTAATAERMVWRLRQGQRLMLFPEGTTTTGDKVLRFHGRLFQPAHLAGVGVQAIALHYEGEAKARAPFVGEDEFLPHLAGILKLDRIDLRLDYCPALPARLDGKAMAAAARGQIAEILAPAVDSEQRRVTQS